MYVHWTDRYLSKTLDLNKTIEKNLLVAEDSLNKILNSGYVQNRVGRCPLAKYDIFLFFLSSFLPLCSLVHKIISASLLSAAGVN